MRPQENEKSETAPSVARTSSLRQCTVQVSLSGKGVFRDCADCAPGWSACSLHPMFTGILSGALTSAVAQAGRMTARRNDCR